MKFSSLFSLFACASVALGYSLPDTTSSQVANNTDFDDYTYKSANPLMQRVTPDIIPTLRERGVSEEHIAQATFIEFPSSDDLQRTDAANRWSYVMYFCESSPASPYTPYVIEAAKNLWRKPKDQRCQQLKKTCTNMTHYNTAWLDVCGKKGPGVLCRDVADKYINNFVGACKKHSVVGGYMRYVFSQTETQDYNAYKANPEGVDWKNSTSS